MKYNEDNDDFHDDVSMMMMITIITVRMMTLVIY